MIKSELIKKVANETHLPVSEVNAMFCATVNTIISEIVNGGEVRIRNFATFSQKTVKAKKGYDFKKKRTIEIPERCVPIARFCQDLKTLSD